jgi:hypothetical protein
MYQPQYLQAAKAAGYGYWYNGFFMLGPKVASISGYIRLFSY